jgi:type IV secretory pathway component VirB8
MGFLYLNTANAANIHIAAIAITMTDLITIITHLCVTKLHYKKSVLVWFGNNQSVTIFYGKVSELGQT